MKPRHQNSLSLAARSSSLLGLRTITFSLLAVGSTLAQDTWDGGAGTGNWADGNNWVDNTAPTSPTGILTFVGGSGAPIITNNDISGLTTGAINFTNDNTSGKTSAFTLGGNAITLGGDITTTIPTGPDGTITDIINLDLVLNGNRKITTGRSSNKIHNLTINGVISGAFTLTKEGNAVLTLTNAGNSFTGLTVGGGTNGSVTVNSISNSGVNSAIGSGSLIRLDGGALNYNGSTAAETNRAISLTGGGGAINNNATSAVSIEFKGTVTNDSATTKTLALGGNVGTANLFSGNLANNTTSGTTYALSFLKNGTSTWILSGSNTYTGTTTIDAGTVVISKLADSGTETNLGTAGNIQMGFGNGGAGLTFTGASGSTARQVIIGRFNGLNGGGGATISSTGASTGIATNGLKFTNSVFNLQESSSNTSTRKLTLTGDNTDANEIAGTIQNAVNSGGTITPLEKTGAGRWILGGSNSYTGTTTVSGGVLQLNHTSALGSGNLTLSGGILGLGAGDFTRVLGSGTGQVQFTTSAASGFAAYGGNRSVNLGGSGGTVVWASSGNFFIPSGNNTMALSHATADGTLDFQNAIDLNGFGRTFDVANGAAAIDAKLSGNISGVSGVGPASFTKAGTGTLVVSGTNSYTGATNINAGALIVNGSQSSATGAVSVSNDGTRLMGTGTIGGATTVNSGAIYSPGSATATVGNQILSSNLTFGNGSIFEWDINANSTVSGFDTVAVGENLNGSTGANSSIFRVVFGSDAKAGINNTENTFWNTPHGSQEWSMTSIFGKDFTSGFFTSVQTYDSTGIFDVSSKGLFTITGSSLTWTAVPEPSSALAGLLIGAGLLRRRRA